MNKNIFSYKSLTLERCSNFFHQYSFHEPSQYLDDPILITHNFSWCLTREHKILTSGDCERYPTEAERRKYILAEESVGVQKSVVFSKKVHVCGAWCGCPLTVYFNPLPMFFHHTSPASLLLP